jgi:hypothetical protein
MNMFPIDIKTMSFRWHVPLGHTRPVNTPHSQRTNLSKKRLLTQVTTHQEARSRLSRGPANLTLIFPLFSLSLCVLVVSRRLLPSSTFASSASYSEEPYHAAPPSHRTLLLTDTSLIYLLLAFLTAPDSHACPHCAHFRVLPPTRAGPRSWQAPFRVPAELESANTHCPAAHCIYAVRIYLNTKVLPL